MTLVEFISPLSTHKDRVLAVLYFKQQEERVDALTIDEIRQALKRARAPKAGTVNLSDVLNKCNHFVDTPGKQDSKRLWHLTSSGVNYVRKIRNLHISEPEIEHDIGSLSKLIDNITNPLVKDYLVEAKKCLQVGALRACVVFVWNGAIYTLQNQILLYGEELNSAIKKHDWQARDIKTIDDFAYIKDKTIILACRDLGRVDKNQRGALEEALNLRNRCGHPGKYRPGVQKVSSFIEDIISIIFKDPSYELS